MIVLPTISPQVYTNLCKVHNSSKISMIVQYWVKSFTLESTQIVLSVDTHSLHCHIVSLKLKHVIRLLKSSLFNIALQNKYIKCHWEAILWYHVIKFIGICLVGIIKKTSGRGTVFSRAFIALVCSALALIVPVDLCNQRNRFFC